ncbi:Mediator of RNA polymerase II transcription subunit 13 [Halotydeus destructor]|nr:Mediator of RNA polymerase II transcription subunit 13 [Halotydeus destructor]
MTHPNFVTNGASLEDCHTNFFALADLCGIRWKRLGISDSYLATSREPLEDPVLTSYSKCLAADLLCVWRRVVSNRTSSLAAGDATAAAVRPEPGSQATFTKELWIFWYGKEPEDLNEFLSTELTETEQGSWENGLSYECRTLLFKAFHNLIERCLLSRGFARFGKWFVQPSHSPANRKHPTASTSSRATNSEPDSKTQLTIAFNFFVHGESTVCASIDVRQHPPIYRISKSHLSAAQGTQGGLDVILGPFGISGMLTGQTFKDSDPAVQRLLNEWKMFYPISQSQKESAPKRHSGVPFHIDLDEGTDADAPAFIDSQLPAAVEVVVAGIKMKYPSCYVHLAADSTDGSSNVRTSSSPKTASSNGVSSKETIPAPTSSSSLLTPPCSPPNQLGDSCKLKAPCLAPKQPDLPTSEFKLRDAVNQEINVSLEKKQNNQISTEASSEDQAAAIFNWNFSDPCSKIGCNCFRCKAKKGNNSNNIKTGSTPNLSGSSGSGRGRPDNKQNKPPKVLPFHKRVASVEVLYDPEQPLTVVASDGQQAASSTSTANSNANNFTVASNAASQPKTPSFSYKSPLGTGGMSSVQSSATTPGANCLDSPRSVAQSVNGEGPASTNPEPMSLPSVSPHPVRNELDGRSPMTSIPQRERSRLEEMLSPCPSANYSQSKPAFGQESPLVNNWPPSIQSQSNDQPDSASTPVQSEEVESNGVKRPLLSRSIDNLDRINSNCLYDFSSYTSISDNWNLPPAKRSRTVHTKNTNSELGSFNSKPKDPYEFNDDDTFGSRANGVASLNDSNLNDIRVPAEMAFYQNSAQFEFIKPSVNGDSVNSPAKTRDFTSTADLTPSIGDLDNMFDSSGDESSEVSNSARLGHAAIHMNDKQSHHSSHIPGVTELIRMFPTPPSLEPNAAPSPNVEASLLDDAGKIDVYPNSPATLEHLKDSSYVYKPTVISKFIAPSKYGPLADLQSAMNMPTGSIYKPCSKTAQQTSQQQQSTFLPPPPKTSGYIHQTNSMPPMYPGHPQLRQMGPPQMYQPGHGSQMMSPNHRMASPMRHQVGPGMSPMQPHMPGHHPQTPMHPSQSPSQYSPYMPSEHHRPMNPNMFSPHHGPNQSEMSNAHHSPYPQFPAITHGQQSPRVVHGANLMSPLGPHGRITPMTFENRDPAFMAGPRSRAPENVVAPVAQEVSSLLVNLALSDSVMNLYKDHNFESCTLCVCNMNLKGADVGVYLPDALIPGIYDESQYKCTCGFSAVINRHRSALAGLFYEDETEITGIIYDPNGSAQPVSNALAIDCELKHNSESTVKDTNGESEQMSQVLVDLVKAQCGTLLPSCSLFAKSLSSGLSGSQLAVNASAQTKTIILSGLKSVEKSVLESSSLAIFRSDSCELAYFALISGKAALDSYPPKIIAQQLMEKRQQKSNCLHYWQFLDTTVPSNNFETVSFLRSLQPILQASVQKKPKAMWEVTYNVAGPLTWRQFHRLAGRGTEDQCEPQPIPTLLAGHDKDWVTVSPFALKYWEKLMLEPYADTRDVAYLVVAPSNSYMIPQIRTFFKELSTTYEMLRLGKHCPIVNILRDGIMKVAYKSNVVEEKVDEWFDQIGDSSVAAKLKLYAQTCKAYLVPLLKAQPLDRTLFQDQAQQKQANQAGGDANPGQQGSQGLNNGSRPAGSTQNDPSERFSFNDDSGLEAPSHGLPSFSTMAQAENEDEDPKKQPAIVIYIVEPFTFANLDEETYRLACLGLLRCYSQMMKALPENVRSCVNLQIVALDAIMGAGSDFKHCTRQEQLKSLAFAVYSQSRKSPCPPSICKSLTGFGPAASLDRFLKERPLILPRLYTPPFVLAPLKDKNTELSHMFGDQKERSHNMFVCYCLTDNQKWIVASCSNERGDLLETTLINIEVPNRTRRRKATVRQYGLHKLMEFILQVMSDSNQTWRLVVGRLGRVGHGELREWSSLLSKKSLVRYSKNLKEPCGQCKQNCTHDAPIILSACLISLEADTALRVFSDQYTPDDRFSSSCNTCSLSTPEDASCTHILTFPTSTTMQSSQGTFQIDPIGMGSMGDDDLMNAFGADTADLGDDDGLGGLFDWGDPDDPTMPVSPGEGGHNPPGQSASTNHDAVSESNTTKTSGILGEFRDEPLQLLQQPLALGYYVSTAPAGPLPKWFWSAAPHLRDSRPCFLKSALLVHTPSVHSNSDDLYQSSSNKSYHPMDSNLTTDVLRYVLEGYNSLSWLAVDPATHDRISCLPIHLQILLQLYHTVQALS